MYACMCIYACIYVCVYVLCMYACSFVCHINHITVCILITTTHIYICMHQYTHIHTLHIHIYIGLIKEGFDLLTNLLHAQQRLVQRVAIREKELKYSDSMADTRKGGVSMSAYS